MSGNKTAIVVNITRKKIKRVKKSFFLLPAIGLSNWGIEGMNVCQSRLYFSFVVKVM